MSAVALSVVVPVHDGAALLPRQLDAILASIDDPARTEVVVVDNRSTDGSADTAKAWARGHAVALRVVTADARAGEPYARNVGAQAADGELLAFCDADDEVDRGWLAGMRRRLSTDVYVTGPVEVDALNPPWLASTRTEMSSTPGRTYGGVPFAHGCNMGFQRRALLDLGGFDETYRIGCDVEIGIRAWRAGVELAWEPAALVQYRLRSSLSELHRQARDYGRVQLRLRALVDDPEGGAEALRARRRRMGWLLKSAPRLVTRAGRARWVWVAGRLRGELEAAPGKAGDG